MNKKYPTTLIAVAIISLMLGFIISGIVIKGAAKNTQVVKVLALPASFPDVKNDPAYSNFLNNGAIDPTQAVHVGGSQNSSPFSGP
jgi:hypothetical protein